MKKLTILFASAFLIFSSCETEFSLNGDYQITPVIAGLLDQSDNYHGIKITKAFLGDGDNLLYAQNPDSNYFNSVDAKVVELLNGSPTGREWILEDSILTSKDSDGIFYGPEQKIYGFYEPNLDPDATYRLEATLENTYEITAETGLIHNFAVTGSVLNPAFPVTLANNNVTKEEDYKTLIINISEGFNASRYNYKMTFRWTETYTDMTTQSFSLTYNNGDKLQEKPELPLTHTAVFSGKNFYVWLGSNISEDDNVEKRVFDGIDIKVSIAHYELDQYMSVSEPVTGIAQIQPEYTNVNGGLGIFSARHIYTGVNNLQLNAASIKELCGGQYTGTLKFCSTLPEHQTEFFYCN